MAATAQQKHKLQPVEYNPFGGPEITGLAPATESQLEIWLSCYIGGADASRAYNESVSLELDGTLNRQALDDALQAVVDRHEGLRSVFSGDGRQICIYKTIPVDLLFEDVSNRSSDEQISFLESYAVSDSGKEFNLVSGPLFRIALFRLSATRHYLTITAHHIMCDGWSLGILMHDIAALYNAAVQQVHPYLAPAITFSSYARYQQQYTDSQEYKTTEDYWVQRFQGDVPVLNVPTDFPRPLVRTYKSRRDDFTMPPQLVAGIRQVGARLGCSFITTVLAAFEVYLNKLTGQHDIVVGLPAAGQSASGMHALVGHCVHLLPMRSHVDTAATFEQYLKQRKPEILDAYDHQQITFGSLLKKLSIPRDPTRIPLVPVVFNIDMGMDKDVAFHGLRHRLVSNPRSFESFELFINATGSEQSLVFEWSYNTQLFRQATIKGMMEGFEELLQAIINAPGNTIGQLEGSSQKRAAVNRNNTTVAYPDDIGAHTLVTLTSGKYADKVAIQFENQSITYTQVGELSTRMALFLKAKGVKKGDVVALAIPRSYKTPIALLAIMKVGAAYLPLDPAYPENRLSFMVSDAGADVLVTSPEFAQRIGHKGTTLFIDDIWSELDSIDINIDLPQVKGNDLAYILYTSGTTGTPKGIQIEHHSLVNLLLSMQHEPGITDTDNLLAITTISFDIAGLELFLPLISGAQLTMAGVEAIKDGRILLQMMRTGGITMMQATPSSWRMILDAGWDEKLPIKVLCGGEPLTEDLAAKLHSQAASLWNMYGPTETTIWSMVKQITDTTGRVTVGKPINNTKVYILDNSLNRVKEGVAGELYISGAGVARGYINLEEATRERFLPDPYDQGQRMYRTGDLGMYVADGDIQHLGRADNQVKVRGFRIELGEIEHALVQQHDVKEAVVVAKNDQLHAFIVPAGAGDKSWNIFKKEGQAAPADAADATRWRQALKMVLPEHMIPAHFMVIGIMPQTLNGKVDRLALTRQAGAASVTAEYMAPRTPMERIVSTIWEGVLGRQKISITEDFFEIGGHSLLAVMVITRLEKETHKRLPVSAIFEAPTIEKLALLADKDAVVNNEWESLVEIKPGGSKPPLYIVHGYGMDVNIFAPVASYMDAEQPVFGLQGNLLNAAEGPVMTMEGIAKSYVDEMVTRHNKDEAFALAGYSFGGFIAFEIAKQLRARGRTVTMLAMFDAYNDTERYREGTVTKLFKKVVRQFPKSLFILKSFVKYPSETIGYQFGFFKKKVKTTSGNEVIDAMEQKVNEKYDFALRNYTLVPYPEVLDIFKVKKRLYFLDDPEYLGWRQYAEKGIEIHDIEGDHKTFLMPPYNQMLAAVLQKTLDKRASRVKIRKLEKV